MFSASKVFQGIRVSDVDIVDPTYCGIMFQTNYVGGQPQFPVKDTVFTNVSITGRAARAVTRSTPSPASASGPTRCRSPARARRSARSTFNNLTFSNNVQNIKNTTSTFTITINP